jgi:hypothetical protein
MKRLISEIEDFQAETEKDLGLDKDSLINQSTVNYLQNWEDV